MRRKLISCLVLAAATVTTAANAAVVTLQTTAAAGSDFILTYQSTLGPDEGLRTGDKFVIYDFAGYVAHSVFSTAANFAASTQLVTPGLIVPGQTDDPTLTNLVFTYTGADTRNTGGPYRSLDINGLGAKSIYSTTVFDAFTTVTTKNNPVASENTAVYTLGTTQVPTGSVPEPAAWMLMIGGFGLVGASARRHRKTVAA